MGIVDRIVKWENRKKENKTYLEKKTVEFEENINIAENNFEIYQEFENSIKTLAELKGQDYKPIYNKYARFLNNNS